MKIPEGQSESVYRRRTDNTMAKRKSTKGQTTINKTYQTKDRVTRTAPKTGENSGAPEESAVLAPLVTPVVLI